MKKNELLGFMLVALLLIVSCKKEGDMTLSGSLEASKVSSIKLGEPVLFKINNIPQGLAASWGVTPKGNALLNVSGNNASALFTLPGEYTIHASAEGIYASRTVSVDSVIYIPGNEDHSKDSLKYLVNIDTVYIDSTGVVIPGDSMKYIIKSDTVYYNGNTGGSVAALESMEGDHIQLTPSASAIDSSNYIVIMALSENFYNCLNNYLVISTEMEPGSFTVDIKGVNVPTEGNCTEGQMKALGAIFLYCPIDGFYNLTVKFNGYVYQGTIVKTGNVYTFTWPYDSGLTLSPLTVSN
jgi:hypothetical protein